jgi:hypothetical protein
MNAQPPTPKEVYWGIVIGIALVVGFIGFAVTFSQMEPSQPPPPAPGEVLSGPIDNRPITRRAGDGIARGTKNFVKGIWDGIWK